MPDIWTYFGLFLVATVLCVQSETLGESWRNASCDVCNTTRCEKPLVMCGSAGETKDECGCCPACLKPDKDALCQKIQCPKRKQCTLNIQGIPMCRCPSLLNCPKRVKLTKRYCASNGRTYKSRCAMGVSECQTKTKLKVKHRGPCVHTEKDRKTQEKLKEKLAKKTRRKAKKERKRKKLKRRRRMRRMMRTGFHRRRMY